MSQYRTGHSLEHSLQHSPGHSQGDTRGDAQDPRARPPARLFARALARTALVIGLAGGCALTLPGCVLALAGVAAGGGALVATDRRPVSTQAKDREIQGDALFRLRRDLPKGSHVNVAVFNLRVLMTGEVPNQMARQRAEEIVRDIGSVRTTVNELVVTQASTLSSRSNDTFLEGRVKAQLVTMKGISANNFKVVCERGVVYLMGLVTPTEGAIGADAASRVPGVVKVVKVFQYLGGPVGAGDGMGSPLPTNPTNSTGTADPDAGATVDAVPDSSVSTRPLDPPPPAPAGGSSSDDSPGVQ